jgi:hypothetical protein
MTEPAKSADKSGPEQHWLVRKGTIRQLWIWGIALLALLVAGDLLLTPHPHFGVDGTFGFHAWYGLLTCIAMVLVAKFLGKFISRKDTYYDDQ